jgi:hypothetical protein
LSRGEHIRDLSLDQIFKLQQNKDKTLAKSIDNIRLLKIPSTTKMANEFKRVMKIDDEFKDKANI